MSQLQRTVPVLFDLLLSVESYPQKLMSSVLQEMMKKSSTPFKSDDKSEIPVEADEDVCMYKSLSYFPNLPRVRMRRSYEADKNTKERICSKKGSGHPSLLPGIFTLLPTWYVIILSR